MAETRDDDFADDIQLASELMAAEAAENSNARPRGDAGQAVSAENLDAQDNTLGSVHLGSQAGAELSGLDGQIDGGADTLQLMEAWGNGTVEGGVGASWTDVAEPRDANEIAPTDGWTVDVVTGSESESVTISGVPSGATLSAGVKNDDGTWTLTSQDLSGLTMVLGAGPNIDFTLTATATDSGGDVGVTATSTEDDVGDTAQPIETFDVPLDVVADAPTPTANEVSANEETATTEAPPLDAASFESDENSNPQLQIPTDETAQKPIRVARRLLPESENESEFVAAVAPEPNEVIGGEQPFFSPAGQTARSDESTDEPPIEAIEPDTVAPQPDTVANAPLAVGGDISGNEDSAIALDVTAALTDTDGSETLSVTISGVPAGATLSAGTDNGDGTWTLTQAQLAGLTLTPPADSDADFTLTVTATATEANGGDTANTSWTFDVAVDAVADAPTLTANDVSGNEDTAIALDITSALTDTDGSESLSVVVSGVPAGATLSAGTDNGDGTWTLTQAQLSGLTLTPPAGSDADFTLTVTSTATEATGGNAQTVDTFDIAVHNVINGTAGADSLIGTGDDDAMYGLGGDDLLKGLGGDDVVDGGDGDDVLWGQGGDDILFGGSGDDLLKGHGGEDTLEGGLGSDDLDGGGGTDTLSYAGSSAGVTVDLAAGTASGGDAEGDTFANFENLTGSEYADSLTGDSGDNVLIGGGGADTLDGGAGDDYLAGGAGDDVAWGGDGADTFLLMEAWGSDTFHGGTGGGWTDVVELQDANGNAPTDGWSFTLTTGSVVSQGDGFIELSDDSAGTITLDDGTSLIFDEVEKFIW